MRIPAIFYDFKGVICHTRSKRPVWTVRVNMSKKHDFNKVICHARSKKDSLDRET